MGSGKGSSFISRTLVNKSRETVKYEHNKARLMMAVAKEDLHPRVESLPGRR